MRTVAVVDDHPLLASAVAEALQTHGIADAVVVPPLTPNAQTELVAADPDLCLLDLDLGENMAGGMRFVRAAADAGLTFVMLTGSTDSVALGRCIEAGAVGVITKMSGFADVVQQVDTVLHGGKCNPDSMLLEWVLASHRHDATQEKMLRPLRGLSEREQFVLHELMEGRRVDEIAIHSFVSVATVRSQVRSILVKLGVQSQLAAVATARRAGWEYERAA